VCLMKHISASGDLPSVSLLSITLYTIICHIILNDKSVLRAECIDRSEYVGYILAVKVSVFQCAAVIGTCTSGCSLLLNRTGPLYFWHCLVWPVMRRNNSLDKPSTEFVT
jgi:hypothetical protein